MTPAPKYYTFLLKSSQTVWPRGGHYLHQADERIKPMRNQAMPKSVWRLFDNRRLHSEPNWEADFERITGNSEVTHFRFVKRGPADNCREQGWLLKNSVFLKKVKNRVIESV